MFSLASALFLFIALVLVLASRAQARPLHARPGERRPPRVLVHAGEIHAELSLPVRSQLARRAAANAGLAASLGVRNAFTSPREAVRSDFRKVALSLLAHYRQEVPHPGQLARECARRFASRDGDGECGAIRLVETCQRVALAFAVVAMMGARLEALPAGELEGFPGLLMSAIVDMKKCSAAAPDRAARLHELAAFVCTGSDCVDLGGFKPLEVLIPIYETTPRLVLLGVLEMLRRNLPARECELAAFSRYLLAEGRERDVPPDDRARVERFVKELLRLYVPTKRVHRGGEEPANVDLEAFHRQLWSGTQREPRAFDPLRFAEVGREELRRRFVPFSTGPLACVARGEAPKMIALVLGAVLELVFGAGAEVSVEGFTNKEKAGWEDGMPLINERAAYEGVRLWTA